MAEIKILKIDSDGLSLEHTGSADDLTMNQYTVDGGLVASSTGIDMNNGTIIDSDNISFTDPATDGLTQTAGVVAADDLMAKERENLMTTAGSVTFPTITDDAGEVDSLRLPQLAGTPTATPTTGGEGHLVWDSTNDKMYVWDGAAWSNNFSESDETNKVVNDYTADEALTANDMVYISAADNVSKVDSSGSGIATRAVGFAKTTVIDTAAVEVCSEGVLTGFSGLTAGDRMFADPATAGLITNTTPVGAGNTIVQAGYAKNTTTLHIHIEQLGRRV